MSHEDRIISIFFQENTVGGVIPTQTDVRDPPLPFSINVGKADAVFTEINAKITHLEMFTTTTFEKKKVVNRIVKFVGQLSKVF